MTLQDSTISTTYPAQRKAKLSAQELNKSIAGVAEDYDKAYSFTAPQVVTDKEEKNDSWRYNNNFNAEGYDHIV